MKLKLIIISLIVNLQVVTFCQVPNTISYEEKILGLSIIWKETTINFPYFRFLPAYNYDSLYQSCVTEVVKSKNDYEYYLLLRKFAAFYKDNHTYVNFPDTLSSNYITRTNFTKYKIGVSNIEGKAIITKIGKSTKDEIPIGSEIIEVNSIATKEYLERKICPYFSSSSDQRLMTVGIRNLLLGSLGISTTIKIRTPNKTVKIIKLMRGDNKDDWYPDLIKPFYFKINEGKIVCLKINSFAYPTILDSLKKYLPEIRKAKGLIIDIQNNKGGSSIIAKDFAQYFVSDSIITGSQTKTRLNLGSLNLKGSMLSPIDTVGNKFLSESYLCYKNLLLVNSGIAKFKNLVDNEEKVIIPTVILIGHDNLSASEEFLIYLYKQNHIIFMGEKTGGGNGQPIIFDLPGNGKFAVCTQYCCFPNGKEYYRTGISPKFFVSQNYDDFLNGIDTAFEKAKKYLINIVNN